MDYFGDAPGRGLDPGVNADYGHAEFGAEAGGFSADAADADNEGGGVGQVDYLVAGFPLGVDLLSDVGVQAAREGEDVGHDVVGYVVVVDVAGVGDGYVAVYEVGVVVSGGWAGLGAGYPAQVVSLFEDFGDDVSEGGVGFAYHLHGLADGAGYVDFDVGDGFPEHGGPEVYALAVGLSAGSEDKKIETHLEILLIV